MGNSLHNKIYLGRRAPSVQTLGMLALLVGAAAGLAWFTISSMK